MNKGRRSLSYLAAAALALGSATSAEALTIILQNTGGAEAGTDVYRGFKVAASFWESVITDKVRVNFDVGFGASGFSSPYLLGTTSSSSSNKTRTAWQGALIRDATTPLDAIATANLPAFSGNNVQLNNSVQKALGLYTGGGALRDATIRFNSALPFDFDTRDGFQSVSSDFVAVALHEMGHALGFESTNFGSNTAGSGPASADMFRYKDGAWDISLGGNPYFSIDGGANPLFGNSYFSSGSDGFQTSHWREGRRIHDDVSCTRLLEPQIGVMDPTGGACQVGIVTANDLALFDAIGWDVNVDLLTNPDWSMSTAQMMTKFLGPLAEPSGAVPEPSTWAMLIFGFGAIGAAMRRRPRVAVRFT